MIQFLPYFYGYYGRVVMKVRKMMDLLSISMVLKK